MYIGQPGEEDWVSNKGKNWLLMRCHRKYLIADDAQLPSNMLMYLKRMNSYHKMVCALSPLHFFIPPWYILDIEN